MLKITINNMQIVLQTPKPDCFVLLRFHLSGKTSSLGLSKLLLLSGELSLLLRRQVEEGLVLTRLEVTVISTDNAVGIVNSDRTDIGQSLDLGSALLALSVSELDLELLSTRLNGVPTGQTGSEVHVTGHAEVSRVDDLVGAGVVQDSLGVNTGLVGEGAESSNVVVEGNVDLNGLGDQILDVLDLVKAVLALDVLGVGDHHTGHQTTQRGDTVTLTDTQDGGINVSGTGLEGTVGVGDSTASVVVEMGFNVTAHNTAQHTNKLVDLTGRGTADGVSDTNTVDTNLVDGGVDGEQVNQIGTEGVLAGETDLNTLGLDEFDNLDSGILDVSHVLTVRVLTKVGRSANDDIAVGRVSTVIQVPADCCTIKNRTYMTHTPSTPVSTATRASSMWQRM